MRRLQIFTLFSLVTLLSLSAVSAQDRRYDAGVSRELAEWRKATIHNVEYDLMFDLVENSGVATISFTLDAPQDVVIDFRNTELVADIFVPGEGVPVESALHNEHIIIPDFETKAGANRVSVIFKLDNQSLNRKPDFLYTLLVPDRARTLFPCFDQPYTAYCSLSGGGYSQLDYGQESLAKNTLVDENGKPIHFNSFIGMLNYMSQRGWEFVGPYTTVDSSEFMGEFEVSSDTKWLFKKEVTSAEEITEGLVTRLLYQESKR